MATQKKSQSISFETLEALDPEVEQLELSVDATESELPKVLEHLAARSLPRLTHFAVRAENDEVSRDQPVIQAKLASRLWKTMPALRHLRLDGTRFFRTLNLPNLESLHLVGLAADVPIRRKGKLPALRALRVELDTDPHGVSYDISVLKKLFSGQGLPALTHLDFVDSEFDYENGTALQRALNGPLLHQLQALRLDVDLEETGTAFRKRVNKIGSKKTVVRAFVLPSQTRGAGATTARATSPQTSSKAADAPLADKRAGFEAAPSLQVLSAELALISDPFAHCHRLLTFGKKSSTKDVAKALAQAHLPFQSLKIEPLDFPLGARNVNAAFLKAIRNTQLNNLSINLDGWGSCDWLAKSGAQQISLKGDIKRSFWGKVPSAVAECESLRSLSLDSRTSAPSANELASLFDQSSALSHLSIGCSTDESKMSGLASCWPKLLSHLRAFAFEGFLSANDAAVLMEAVTSSELESLTLFTHPAEDLIEHLGVATGAQSKLRKLDVYLEESDFDEATLKSFATFVRSTHLTSLHCNELEEADQRTFFEALGENQKLVELGLTDVAEGAMEALAEAVGQHSTLESLHVDYSLEHDSQAVNKKLAAAFQRVRRLTGGRDVRDQILRPMLEGGALRELELSGLYSREYAKLPSLYKAIAKSPLEVLQVSVAHDQKSVSALCDAIRHATSLRRVDIAGSAVDAAGLKQVISAASEAAGQVSLRALHNGNMMTERKSLSMKQACALEAHAVANGVQLC